MHRAVLSLFLAASLFGPVSASGQEPVEADPQRSAQRGLLASSPADTEYKFGPEDILQIQVWDRPDLSGLVAVDLSGRIQAPLVGAVRAEGRSPAELSEDLTERYQLLDRSISEVLASVAQYNSRRLTLIGAVSNPGVYGFRKMPDLWGAILTAGGARSEAELARVQIVRQDTESAPPRSITVDLSRGIDRTPPGTIPALQPKDRIIVPSAQEVPVGGDNFNVLGSVNSPGVYRMTMASTVLEAIAVSGGPGPEANLQKVYLTRPTLLGATTYELDIEGYLMDAEPLANLELQPGDTITVPAQRSFFTEFAQAVGRFAPFISLATTIILANR